MIEIRATELAVLSGFALQLLKPGNCATGETAAEIYRVISAEFFAEQFSEPGFYPQNRQFVNTTEPNFFHQNCYQRFFQHHPV